MWRWKQGTSRDAWCGQSMQSLGEDGCGQQAGWVSVNIRLNSAASGKEGF